MLEIQHLDDAKWPGLQAADMVASTTKWIVDGHNATGKVDEELPLLGAFFKVGRVNEAYLLTVLDNQSITDAELEDYREVKPQ